LKDFDIDFFDVIKSVTTEIEVTPQSLLNGNHLMDLPLPEKTLVVLVKRGEKYFVPTGTTILQEKDMLLIITDDQEALLETIQNMGTQKVTINKEI
jgi:cell volume regulation protein A